MTLNINNKQITAINEFATKILNLYNIHLSILLFAAAEEKKVRMMNTDREAGTVRGNTGTSGQGAVVRVAKRRGGKVVARQIIKNKQKHLHFDSNVHQMESNNNDDLYLHVNKTASLTT